MSVFVHLGHGFGGERWAQRWAEGGIPGVNERLPYGYYRAANENCAVRYSEDTGEGHFGELARMGLCKLLGFDLIHTWRNRHQIDAADVVWTHTEREHLAILLLWRVLLHTQRPKVIAQSVWLFDKWQRLSRPTRWLYRVLMNQADVLTVQSPANLEMVRALFPTVRSELVLFGNDTSTMLSPRLTLGHRPLRIAALGNDMHRDWSTLFAAVDGWGDAEVQIASSRCGSARERPANVTVIQAKSARAVTDLYSWADLVVVPLWPNLHASGITVITEASLAGLPVVCSDTGGLRAYFSGDEVCYVPPRDATALRCELEGLSKSDERRFTLARRAQARLRSADLSSTARAQRLRRLSAELLASHDVYDQMATG
jgi:glycosyltransferase involved in cell wall biosynthesis